MGQGGCPHIDGGIHVAMVPCWFVLISIEYCCSTHPTLSVSSLVVAFHRLVFIRNIFDLPILPVLYVTQAAYNGDRKENELTDQGENNNNDGGGFPVLIVESALTSNVRVEF